MKLTMVGKKAFRIGNSSKKYHITKLLGEGSFRKVYETDYKLKGRPFVIKLASTNCESNYVEYNLYQHLKKENNRAKKMFPETRAISKRGAAVLVEKVRVAEDVFRERSENYADSLCRKYFPNWQSDNHYGNWGFLVSQKTKKLSRPVIIDFMYEGSCFLSDIKNFLKSMNVKMSYEELIKRPKL